MPILDISHLSDRTRGIVFMSFTLLVWSGWMVISSYGVHGTLTAYDITALRFGTAGLVLFPVFLKKGGKIGPYGIWGGLALTFMMGAPYNTIALLGMKYAPTSHATLIQASMVLFTTLGGIFFLKEKTSPLRMLGLAISIIGVGFLLYAAPTGGEHMMLGHIFFIVGGLMWSVYSVMMKAWKSDPLQVTAAVCVYSFIIYMPVYWFFLPHHIGMENLHASIFQAIYQGIINSVFALICFNRAVNLLGASTSSAFLPLIPVIATFAAIPVLHEMPDMQEWIGVALASGGVLLSSGIVGNWLKQKEQRI